MAKYCMGIDVGGTTVKMGLFTEEGKVLDKWEIPTRKEENGSFILPDITESLRRKWDEKSIAKEEVTGIGIGIPGPVMEDGTVLKCVNLGWGVFNVVEEVRKLTGIENVKAGNDANVAALGEVWQGGGKGYQNIIMITLGTGVGGGVILGGKILTGSKGAAGEIGHITVNYEEQDTCGCGKKGCLEQFASATGIVKEAKRLLKKSDKPSALRNLQHLSAKAIFDCAKEGDELSIELVEQLGKYLGLAASHIAAVVDPDAFVIGGGVSKAGEVLTSVIKKHYEKNVMFALQGKEFRLAELGNDAGIFGSAKMVLE
ncbi:ROK family glucokinase [[Clostridium] polysaccharolyticum]|uniref:Glucokinase n=1 Tax=[Clostridium] polysaccharolyticum TaxID=29364 RepID=A0A1I0C5J1_9FIRM|nr:ROK family glucokinase [[Clostridium] polysaccharolyticum]SET14798.1 glucokinase [[Clostridium] polysaccharolyticum]